jgi:Ca2+-binding RTX toxin-like protein
MHSAPRALLALAALCGAFAIGIPSAHAATTIGQVFTPTAETKATVVQTGVQSGAGYTVPVDGVITSWSFQSETVASTVRLKAVRRNDDGSYFVAGESELQTTTPGQLQSFPTRVPVRAGDFIGTAASTGKTVAYTGANEDTVVLAPNDQPAGSSATYSNVQGIRVNVTAQIEPDADGDGFGDESQDLCNNDPTVQTACAADLRLEAAAERATVYPDGEIAFNLRVTNGGSSRAIAVKVTAELSDELRLVGTEGGVCTGGPPLTCTVGDLAKDQTATVKLVAKALRTGTGSVAARASSSTVDPSVAANAAGATVEVRWRPGRCANDFDARKGGGVTRGTSAGDSVIGGLGRDLLLGLAGSDCLFGGAGRDRLIGDEGNDSLDGGPGNDSISGGSGIDRIEGGTGNDRISAVDRRRDTIDCGPGRDTARVDRGDRVKRCERVIRAKRAKKKRRR